MPPTSFTSRLIRIASVLALVGMAVRCASAQSVVFSNPNPTRVAYTSSSGTNQDHQAYAKRVSANQRGDIFWVNDPINGGNSDLVELPAGSTTEVVLISSLAGSSISVTVDPLGNVWVMNGYTHVLYVPFTNGTYPSGLDISANPPPECSVPVTGTAVCDWPNIDPASYGYYVELSDIQVDASGNIYAASYYDSGTFRNRILKYDGTTQAVTVLLDNIANPSYADYGRLAVTSGGDIYYTDGYNLYYSAAGSGTYTINYNFSSPNGVSLDRGGNLYITDPGTNSITFVPNIGGTLSFSNAYVIFNTLVSGNPVYGPVGIDGFGKLSFEAGASAGGIWQTPIGYSPLGTNSVGVGGTLGPNTFNVIFNSAATFGSFSVSAGTGTSPYSIGSNTCVTGTAYAAGATCTVSVGYTANGAGSQSGVIEALSNTGTLLGEARLSALSIAPLLNVDPGTVTAIGTTWHAPSSIAVDAAGNTYVADRATGGIYKNGSTTSIVSGFSSPSAAAVDAAGNLYIADTGNNRIQEIPYASGVYGTAVTLYTGLSGSSGLALDYSGNLYVADSGNSRVLLLASAANRQPGSIATTIGSGFTTPVAVAVDNNDGYLFVADSGTKTIVQINLATSMQTTVASGLTTVAGIALDAGNSLYVVDSGTQTISRIGNNLGNFGSSTTLQTIVAKPTAVAVDTLGNVYAVDTADATVGSDNRTVGSLKFGSVQAGSSSSPLTATITNGGTVASHLIFNTPPYTGSGNTADFSVQNSSSCSSGLNISYGPGCALSAVFNPVGAASYTDTLTFSSNAAANTLVLTGTGTASAPTPVFGSMTVTGFPTSTSAGTASYVTVSVFDTTGAAMPSFTGTVTLTSSDAKATLPAAYTFTSSDAGVHSFPVTLNTGGTQSITATSGSVSASETGIVVGDYIWVVNATGTTSKLSESGGSVASGGSSAGTSAHGGLAFDSSGNVWSVTSGSNSLVFSTKTGATLTTYSGGGLSSPVGIAVDGAGSLWIANSGNNSVSEFLNSGTAQSGTAGYGASGTTALSGPSAILIDGAGGVWVTSKTGNSLTHIIGAATPVVTPLSTAVASGSVGVEP